MRATILGTLCINTFKEFKIIKKSIVLMDESEVCILISKLVNSFVAEREH